MRALSYRKREVAILNAFTQRIAGHLSPRLLLILLALITGLASGLAAFVLKSLVHLIQRLLTQNIAGSETSWLYFLFPAIGILLCTLFIRYIVRDDISHGVTKILYAISRKRARIKAHNSWTSMVASAITIGFGGSVGAEAPIVLTGSAIGSDLGKRFHLPTHTIMLLVGCGAAGAVAGIFKAPIAGVMFTLEVLMLDLNMALLLPLLTTAITAVCVSYALYGTAPMFSFHMEKAFSIDVIPACLLLGIFCGFVSLYFTRVMNWLEKQFAALNAAWKKYLVGALLLGILIYFAPVLYGEGYDVIEQLINDAPADEIMHNTLFYGHGPLALLIYLTLVLLLKVFASTATNAAGGCGGVFAPSLFVGAIAGYIFSKTWDVALSLNVGNTGFVLPQNCSLYGMAGLMSGIMHAPLTGIFLIAELTGGYQLFVPIMIVSVMSYLTINLFESHSIYAMRLARRGELITHDKDAAILTMLNLERLIERDFATVHPDWDLTKVVGAICNSRRNLFPVVNIAGQLIGVMSLDAVRKYIFRPELYLQYHVRDFMKEPPAVLRPGDTLREATAKFDETKAWSLPVVNEDNIFQGFISRSGLFNAYRRTLVNISSQ